jgi:hypothetical protein
VPAQFRIWELAAWVVWAGETLQVKYELKILEQQVRFREPENRMPIESLAGNFRDIGFVQNGSGEVVAQRDIHGY